jgi:superoxide dismutase, Fe-Mn family
MERKLPQLPYEYDALLPFMSPEALKFQHDKHHQAYVSKTNELIKGTQFENHSLEDLVLQTEGTLFNNAAQAYNYAFFWNCMDPKKGGHPDGKINEFISKAWGNYENFLTAPLKWC